MFHLKEEKNTSYTNLKKSIFFFYPFKKSKKFNLYSNTNKPVLWVLECLSASSLKGGLASRSAWTLMSQVSVTSTQASRVC